MTTGPVLDLATFASLLRGRGLTVTPEQVSDMARAVMLIDAAEESQVRASLRALPVSDPMQVPIFDDEFTRFFSGWAPGESPGVFRRNRQNRTAGDSGPYLRPARAGTAVPSRPPIVATVQMEPLHIFRPSLGA